jgi:6-phospho-3-hexuloisomerase
MRATTTDVPRRILDELGALYSSVAVQAPAQLADAIAANPRVFLTGQGRSRLIAAAFAMRLMHLGLDAHLVGDATTPAVARGDLVIALSGSGSTETTRRQAEKAKSLGAQVAIVSGRADGALADVADLIWVLPTTDTEGAPTNQHAGSLFEQASLIFADSVTAILMKRLAESDADLDGRHDNLQ